MKMIRHYLAHIESHVGPYLDQRLMADVRNTLADEPTIEQYHVSAELWKSGEVFFAHTFSFNDNHDMRELAADHRLALHAAETDPDAVEVGLVLLEKGCDYAVITVYGE